MCVNCQDLKNNNLHVKFNFSMYMYIAELSIHLHCIANTDILNTMDMLKSFKSPKHLFLPKFWKQYFFQSHVVSRQQGLTVYKMMWAGGEHVPKTVFLSACIGNFLWISWILGYMYLGSLFLGLVELALWEYQTVSCTKYLCINANLNDVKWWK